MNVRAVRIRLTLLYTLLSAIAVIALAVVAVRFGTERIEDGAARDAEDVISGVSLQLGRGEDATADNTWQVHIGEGDDYWEDPLGDTWVEPPLYSVAENAIAWDTSSSRFEQDGVKFLAFGQKLNDTESLVTAVDLSYYLDRADSLRLRMSLAAAGAVLGVAIVGWFVSGRAMAPVRAANARQRDFIADAAHELRAPLAVIRASASQSLSRPRDADAYVSTLNEIDSAAQSAGAAVAELLELARIDSGQFSPRLAPLRLDLLVEEVVAGIRVEGCSFVTTTERAILVDADHALLHHALENVVRNAAARSTNVTVSVGVDAKRANVTVTDDGPGFAPELLGDVFERFRRGDQRGSSGLGLAITRSIVLAHKGDVEARNRTGSPGAEVQLWLPVVRESRR